MTNVVLATALETGQPERQAGYQCNPIEEFHFLELIVLQVVPGIALINSNYVSGKKQVTHTNPVQP
jgi:hypothetical protein